MAAISGKIPWSFSIPFLTSNMYIMSQLWNELYLIVPKSGIPVESHWSWYCVWLDFSIGMYTSETIIAKMYQSMIFLVDFLCSQTRIGVITYSILVLEERVSIHMLTISWLYWLQLIPCMTGSEQIFFPWTFWYGGPSVLLHRTTSMFYSMEEWCISRDAFL